MKDFITKHIKSRCEVVVEEKDLTRVLKVLNDNGIRSNLSIGECNWKEAKMWYIMFRITNKQLTHVRAELEKGDFTNILILTNTDYWVKVEKVA